MRAVRNSSLIGAYTAGFAYRSSALIMTGTTGYNASMDADPESSSPQPPLSPNPDVAFAAWCADHNVAEGEITIMRVAFDAAYLLGTFVAKTEAAIEAQFRTLNGDQPPEETPRE